MLKITHLAHACFLIENGLEKLIIDPCDKNFGYEMKNEKVNYLLVSHEHWDHNCVDNIEVINNTGSFKINKINSYHDQENGNLRGTNIIHVIETIDTRICHLGDLGHTLSEEQTKLIGKIDILLIPVGGIYTINYQEAIEVAKQLNSHVVIPMHYKTPYWGEDKGIDSLDMFTNNIAEYKITELEKCLEYIKPSEKTLYII